MKKTIHNPHDRFFRNALSHPKTAREFFETHLPLEIQNKIKWDSLKACKESYLDEKLKLFITDMLFSAQFNEGLGYIYLLNEHASTPKPLIPFYLWKCMVGIIDDHLKKHPTKKLPMVYPLIFYTGSKEYNYSTCVFDLFQDSELMRDIFINPFQLVDVKKIPDEALRQKTYLGIMELSMKYIYERDILPCLQGMVSLFQSVLADKNISYLQTVLTYLAETREAKDKEAFSEIVRKAFSHEEGENTMVTIAESWVQEGYEKGILKGRNEGRNEGRREEKLEVVRRLSQKGMPLKAISEITDLSVTELQDYLVSA